MGEIDLSRIRITSLKRISVDGGDVLHAIKRTDEEFVGFGEAYFSMVEAGAVKAWKLHRQMTLNLVVPIGEVRFVFFSDSGKARREESIGVSNYCRLTVPPGIWFGFQGLAEHSSLILNVASIPHDPDEVERKSQEEIEYAWETGK